MKHLDLFSGIGGFALASSWVWGEDHEIVSFCEIEPYAQKVLKKHWPDVPCHDDIKTLKGDNFGTIDLITGGFPCQPFSVAGKQGGSADDRYLWPEMFRVIQEAKPTWIIGENVAGLINMVEFEQCFLDLENEGYETQAFIIPACGVDAKHRRDRVWIVANSNSKRECSGSGKVQGKDGEIPERYNYAESCNSSNHPATDTKRNRWNSGSDTAQKNKNKQHRECEKSRQQWEQQGFGVGKVYPDVPNSNSGGLQGSENTGVNEENWDKPLNQLSEGLHRGNRTITRRKTIWQPEPDVGRVVDGVPNRVDRLKGLGNAIVPQVVVPIMQAIKSIEDNL